MAASVVSAGKLEEDAQLPYLLVGEDVLFPMKIDVTIGGARIVDTFCWRIYNSFVTPDEFAWQLCSDLNLSASFQAAISMQIQEQVLGFQEMVTALRAALARGHRPPWSRMLAMNVGIRHFTVDYSDKFQWDIFSSAAVSPEDFARTTCADLGLPSDMEPVIAHKIRENVFRNIIIWLDDLVTKVQVEPEVILPEVPSDVRVTVVAPNAAVDMITNLWRRAKPVSVDDNALIPQPVMPKERDSNADTWIKVESQ